MSNIVKAGDFSGLSKDYSNNRPDYCSSVLKASLGLLNKKTKEVDFLDVGAGTGIWTRMVSESGVKSVAAIEPNKDMLEQGKLDSNKNSIEWYSGQAEETGLPSNSFDWVTMASSFHWTNFEEATKEFHRLLRHEGRFTALWNPRFIENNSVLVEIESFLKQLKPDIRRVSSGNSGITENLTEMLWSSPFFEDVIYLEGRHIINMSPSRYLGAWRSVNDLQTQLGPSKFSEFLNFVENKVEALEMIEATYVTRAWSAKRKD
ncbi:MAG: methyltransferase [Cyanobium sp. NAT70]|nr:methyltransferase [Cyanobium sp. NAT70]